MDVVNGTLSYHVILLIPFCFDCDHRSLTCMFSSCCTLPYCFCSHCNEGNCYCNEDPFECVNEENIDRFCVHLDPDGDKVVGELLRHRRWVRTLATITMVLALVEIGVGTWSLHIYPYLFCYCCFSFDCLFFIDHFDDICRWICLFIDYT